MDIPCYDLTKSLTIPKDIIFIEEREEEEETAETKILFFYLCARRASTASTASVTALLRAGMPGCSSSCSRVNLTLQTKASKLLENQTKILKERRLKFS